MDVGDARVIIAHLAFPTAGRDRAGRGTRTPSCPKGMWKAQLWDGAGAGAVNQPMIPARHTCRAWAVAAGPCAVWLCGLLAVHRAWIALPCLSVVHALTRARGQ